MALAIVFGAYFGYSLLHFHVVHRPDQLQSFPSHILAQHVVDLRRMALDVFLGELLGQLLVTDLQPGFLNGRKDLTGRPVRGPHRPLEGERPVLVVLALSGEERDLHESGVNELPRLDVWSQPRRTDRGILLGTLLLPLHRLLLLLGKLTNDSNKVLDLRHDSRSADIAATKRGD